MNLFQDFKGRAILILRNPYDAILSTHNFMYAGHHGRAPARNFARPGIFILCVSSMKYFFRNKKSYKNSSYMFEKKIFFFQIGIDM